MKKRVVLLMFALVGLGVGCVRNVVQEGTYPPVMVPGPDTGVRFNNVSLVDSSLQGKIAIQGSGWSRTATGTAQLWVQVRNRTDYFMQVEARTQFFDAAKVPLEGPSAWQRLMLSPNTITTYRENSTGSDVAYYYVEIREGR